VQNPLAWVLALMALALAAFKREQQHGWMLDRIENDAGETARKDKQLRSAFREHVQASNEEYIGQMDEVNDQQAQYWRDSFDVYSVRQLAELAKARATQHPRRRRHRWGRDGAGDRRDRRRRNPGLVAREGVVDEPTRRPAGSADVHPRGLRPDGSEVRPRHEYDATRDAVESLLEDVREQEASY